MYHNVRFLKIKRIPAEKPEKLDRSRSSRTTGFSVEAGQTNQGGKTKNKKDYQLVILMQYSGNEERL